MASLLQNKMSDSRCCTLLTNNCLENCCFCLKSRTGCLIIGYLHLVSTLAVMAGVSVPLFTYEVSSKATQGDANIAYFLLYTMFAVVMVVCLLYLGFTIALIVGLHQHKANLVDYFINYVYFVSILHIMAFFWIWYCFDTIIVAAIDVVCFILNVYFILVLSFYHKKMREVPGTVIYPAENCKQAEGI